MAMTTTLVAPDMTTKAVPLLLVEELSHRVINEYAQAIAMVRLSAARTASPEAQVALLSTASRLDSFAQAHRALLAPRVQGDIELSHYLEGLCRAMTAAILAERDIRLSLVGETVVLAADRCWRVALIVAELITNAARHGLAARAGTILVKLERMGESVFCQVIDNGGSVARSPVPSRGMSVVRRLAGELGGQVGWTFGDRSTRVELAIPYFVGENQ
jgi:two-component sensor histidine kinase